ncbi:MAG TPA: addiction module protein [Kofleriaceae bacterium]|jgi:putative addiction module component (TIGR02574 family)
MATPASQVLEQALELTPAERLELARELISSVEPSQSPEWATAWKAEIAKRWSAYEAGSDPGVPFDDEIARARADLRASRP